VTIIPVAAANGKTGKGWRKAMLTRRNDAVSFNKTPVAASFGNREPMGNKTADH